MVSRLPSRAAVPALVAALALALLHAAPAWAATNAIFTVAGTGVAGSSGDGLTATAAQVTDPTAVVSLSDGGFVIADFLGQRIRRVYANGTIGTIAGDGTAGFSGDGGPATTAKLNQPNDLALLTDGGIVIADRANNVIRRIAPDGVITTVAGTGTPGFSGDGGPARGAQLNNPINVASAADGGFYITDRANQRVRRVAADGTITTVAGNGNAGFAGDGGPATAAQLDSPRDIVEAPNGDLLIADSFNGRVRRIDGTGTIATIAGGGSGGDGGPAVAAALSRPGGLAVTQDGGLLIGDQNATVRRISAGGRITTVAGTGVAGYSGDGGFARSAQVGPVVGLDVTPDGGFLIADTNPAVRYVDADLGGPGLPAPFSLNGPSTGPGTGGTGGTGGGGPPGPAGPPGPPGPKTVVERLVVAITSDTVTARSGRSFRLRFVATARALVRIQVRRGRKVVLRLATQVGAGRASVRLRRLPPGRYTCVLTASTSDGQHTGDRAAVVIRR